MYLTHDSSHQKKKKQQDHAGDQGEWWRGTDLWRGVLLMLQKSWPTTLDLLASLAIYVTERLSFDPSVAPISTKKKRQGNLSLGQKNCWRPAKLGQKKITNFGFPWNNRPIAGRISSFLEWRAPPNIFVSKKWELGWVLQINRFSFDWHLGIHSPSEN